VGGSSPAKQIPVLIITNNSVAITFFILSPHLYRNAVNMMDSSRNLLYADGCRRNGIAVFLA
jgi:hypothetical protein